MARLKGHNMRKMWDKLEENSHLFDYWHKELAVRHYYRMEFDLDYKVTLENEKQIELLYRSLYMVNRPHDFFTLIIPNLNMTFALDWLRSAPQTIIINFLEFLPTYILKLKPEIEKLLFLVHIFRPDYKHYFKAIINLLSDEECQFLINKTANQNFRQILKQRQDYLKLEQKHILYGIDVNNALPTIQGDKIQLLTATINNLHNSINEKGLTNYPALLITIEQLFAIGLVPDSLLLFLTVYDNYSTEDKHINEDINANIMKNFNKEARQILPMYALLRQPLAFNFCHSFYKMQLANLTPDLPSLAYLKIYEKFTSVTTDFNNALIGIMPEINTIAIERPLEPPLLYEGELAKGYSEKRFYEILYLAKNKLTSLPHEAFITLEFLRNLLKYDYITTIIDKDILASMYLDLFKWSPNSLFINEEIVADLSQHTSSGIRDELEKIIKLKTYYANNLILTDLREKPDLIKNDELRKLILTTKFMGGL